MLLITELCNVCGAALSNPIYSSESESSITSLGKIVPGVTTVYFCDGCMHLQTTEITDIDGYYDSDYELLIESDEQDQIYCVRHGEKTFRYDHQLKTLLKLIDISSGANVLDYGCGKAATLRKLLAYRGDINPYLFDVSDMYLPFWEKFATEDSWATYTLKGEWMGVMDVITSFFALEHVSSPTSMLKNIRALLKDGGIFYCVVPDVIQNKADFVVIDHINHFTCSSISRLFTSNGFTIQDINTEDHTSAIIVVAKKESQISIGSKANLIDEDQKVLATQVVHLVDYWSSLPERIIAFEAALSDASRIAIYGSGFYGTYIASCLIRPQRIEMFVDRDPYRQAMNLFGKKIVDPESMPKSINTVLVGLNPEIALQNIESINSWDDRKIQFFYL